MTTDERKIKLLIEEKTYTICVKCGKLPENKYMPLCKRCFDIENENQLLSIVILVSKKEGAKSEREKIKSIVKRRIAILNGLAKGYKRDGQLDSHNECLVRISELQGIYLG